MSTQEIFDKAVLHLAEQKYKSALDDICFYRLDLKGKILKCPVGFFIDNETYNDSLERSTVHELIDLHGIKEPFSQNRCLFVELQYAHDISDNAEELKKRLTITASKFMLNDGSVRQIKEFKRLTPLK